MLPRWTYQCEVLTERVRCLQQPFVIDLCNLRAIAHGDAQGVWARAEVGIVFCVSKELQLWDKNGCKSLLEACDTDVTGWTLNIRLLIRQRDHGCHHTSELEFL